MPKASRESSTKGGDFGIVLDRAEDMDGYTTNFVTFRQDIDHSPLLKGLPDDRCQCPHWGYVFNGRVTFDFGDHQEVYEAGDAFYAPPGHIPIQTEPGTEYVQFSPTEELRVTEAAIMQNMQAMQTG